LISKENAVIESGGRAMIVVNSDEKIFPISFGEFGEASSSTSSSDNERSRRKKRNDNEKVSK
jgi:hypothetical protein